MRRWRPRSRPPGRVRPESGPRSPPRDRPAGRRPGPTGRRRRPGRRRPVPAGSARRRRPAPDERGRPGPRPRRRQQPVDHLAHERSPPEEVAQGGPGRRVLGRQQPGHRVPLLGAGEQGDRAGVTADQVVGQSEEGGDRQGVEPAGQMGEHRVAETVGRGPGAAQHQHRRRPGPVVHQAPVAGHQRRRLAGAGSAEDPQAAAAVVDDPPLLAGEVHLREGYRRGETVRTERPPTGPDVRAPPAVPLGGRS